MKDLPSVNNSLKIVGMIAILFLLIGVAQAGDWPMFRHDARHTGYTNESILDDLELLWSYETGGDVDSSPAIANGKVFVGSDDHNVYCLNENTGKQIWSYETEWCVAHSSPVVANGKVFVGSMHGKIYCLDENTGKLIWSYQTDGWVHSSPVVADGKVFVGSWSNEIYCLDANNGRLLWSYKTGSGVHSSPAVADGKVFVGSCDNKIYCLDEDTGNLIWSYETGGSVKSSPAIADGKVFFGACDNKVYCLNENNGNLIWTYKTEAGFMESSPAIANGKVFVGSWDNKIYCLDEETGELIWSYKTGRCVRSSPAVVDGKMFVGSSDDKIYCLDEETGELIWSYKTGSNVGSSPAIANGKVFVGSWDNKIYCFGSKKDIPPEGKTEVQTGDKEISPPDIFITRRDISFNPVHPTQGDLVRITASIHNIGETDANDFIVSFFEDAAFSSSPTTLIEKKTISVRGNSTASCSILWKSEHIGYYIIVVVDSGDVIEESNEANNEAGRTIRVESRYKLPEEPSFWENPAAIRLTSTIIGLLVVYVICASKKK